MSESNLIVWGRPVSRQVVRFCFLLLPLWIFGGGELIRFAWLNSEAGPLERNGLVKGRDFVQFYVAGVLASEGNWNALYDVGELKHEVSRIVPAAAGQIPAPVYGPQVALFFSLFTKLSYLEARWLWFALSGGTYLLGAALVMRTAAPLRGHRALAWITIVCNPALAMLLATGQTGGLAVLAWALAAGVLSKGRPFLCGVCLGLLAYKPPLLIGALPALFVRGDWAALTGTLVSAAAQWSAGMLLTGLQPWREYVASLANLSQYSFLTDTLPHQKQSLSGFFQLLIGPGAIAAVLTTLTAVVVLALWWLHRGDRRTAEYLPMLAATAVLLSPHFYVYDLVVLMPALLIVAQRLSDRCNTPAEWSIAWCSYALLYAPFSGVLAPNSRVQLSTIVLMAFVLATHLAWTQRVPGGSVSGRLEPGRRDDSRGP